MFKVGFLASECNPIAKVGGLADIVGSLPKYLEKLDIKPFIVIPNYGIIDRKKFSQKLVFDSLTVKFNGEIEKFSVFETNLPQSKNIRVYLIQHPLLSDNGIYLSTAATADSKMEVERFTFFSIAALKFLISNFSDVDIIHLNDWHTSIVPYLIKTNSEFVVLRGKALVLTIHNMGHAYQGISDISILKVLGGDLESIKRDLGWNARVGRIDYLEQGIIGADLVNTVSPTYAKEIATPEFCEGLCKVIAKKGERVRGILNGIDYDVFNPLKDKALHTNYSVSNWKEGKRANKLHLQKLANLFVDEKLMLIGMVSRLDEQKGFDLVIKALPEIIEKMPIQLVILGTGKPRFSTALERFNKEYHGRFAYFNLFDVDLASKIYGGCDAFLMPSKFEPCGLGQMIASHYGTPPIVRNTGGLSDSVEDGVTGFKFTDYKSEALVSAVNKALLYFRSPANWAKIVEIGMKRDFSWHKSAKEYVKLYQDDVKLKKRG
ncbi:MAG: glycogen/starch synthase [Nitrososphaerota archaeon]